MPALEACLRCLPGGPAQVPHLKLPPWTSAQGNLLSSLAKLLTRDACLSHPPAQITQPKALLWGARSICIPEKPARVTCPLVLPTQDTHSRHPPKSFAYGFCTKYLAGVPFRSTHLRCPPGVSAWGNHPNSLFEMPARDLYPR